LRLSVNAKAEQVTALWALLVFGFRQVITGAFASNHLGCHNEAILISNYHKPVSPASQECARLLLALFEQKLDGSFGVRTMQTVSVSWTCLQSFFIPTLDHDVIILATKADDPGSFPSFFRDHPDFSNALNVINR
jgi:hypothetical protein